MHEINLYKQFSCNTSFIDIEYSSGKKLFFVLNLSPKISKNPITIGRLNPWARANDVASGARNANFGCLARNLAAQSKRASLLVFSVSNGWEMQFFFS